MEIFQTVLIAAISGIFAGGVFYGAMRVEMRWLRRDVDTLLNHSFGRRTD